VKNRRKKSILINIKQETRENDKKGTACRKKLGGKFVW